MARRSATRSLQLDILDPEFAMLDEIDSGLDIDALKVVSEGINRFRARDGKGGPADHPLHPHPALHRADHVHVFVGGRFVEAGGPDLAEELEANGYERYVSAGV